MRVRLKLSAETRERAKVDMQRIKLFELAHLNEKERIARLELFKHVCTYS